MQVDDITLHDLSILGNNETIAIWQQLNFTHTDGGRQYLKKILQEPLNNIAAIQDVQNTIQQLLQIETDWPVTITNGTIMVLEKYFETPVDSFKPVPDPFSAWLYATLKKGDYSLIKYSVEHTISFLQGLQQITILLGNGNSKLLSTWMQTIQIQLSKPWAQKMLQFKKEKPLTKVEVLTYGHFIQHHFKSGIEELIEIYNKLDAYLSLAIATKKFSFHFPDFKECNEPFIRAEALYHLQLNTPVPYTIALERNQNFLFLTGANMGGKSTFIKAVGVCIYLAHIGMAVPASKMELSLFDGLISNINLTDNITKGESYFFNEVHRIKKTIEKISDGRKWLVLIDELFKGTNQQDAVKCSISVIEGLRKMNNALFILSTHLYEIGHELKTHSNIQFKYFQTSIENDQLIFSYQLQDGISNDRLGYLIMRKEGVVDLLNKL
ncbi:MAG: DNA mismatch repair protein MutS [Hydrotalea flava]|uniref:MutS-related protein n=1 Tax=Hydrotalea sp. TaxID=2881279 RepID=UPI0009458270|nr:DNA mismatch repair protein MutS [Hydrotalea sp.]MBY0348532.1 DNA mismatch repair protein MutS [Hydrotalea flava]